MNGDLKGETTGVVTLMSGVFSVYVSLACLLSLVVAFECQNMLFMYFVSSVQVVKRAAGLKQLIVAAISRFKQRVM